MTEFYFVRHPESVLNADRKFIAGRSESAAVTERGIEQAKQFALAFSKQYPNPDVFFSSPTIRTETLLDMYDKVTGSHNERIIDSNLVEMAQGVSEGKIRSDVYTPEVVAVIAKEQFDFSFPGGESLNDTADRGQAFVKDVCDSYPNSTVLVSTHGQFIRAYVGRLLHWNHYQTTLDPAHYTNNVSLTHITVDNGKATVHFFGRDIIEQPENNLSEL